MFESVADALFQFDKNEQFARADARLVSDALSRLSSAAFPVAAMVANHGILEVESAPDRSFLVARRTLSGFGFCLKPSTLPLESAAVLLLDFGQGSSQRTMKYEWRECTWPPSMESEAKAISAWIADKSGQLEEEGAQLRSHRRGWIMRELVWKKFLKLFPRSSEEDPQGDAIARFELEQLAMCTYEAMAAPRASRM